MSARCINDGFVLRDFHKKKFDDPAFFTRFFIDIKMGERQDMMDGQYLVRTRCSVHVI